MLFLLIGGHIRVMDKLNWYGKPNLSIFCLFFLQEIYYYRHATERYNIFTKIRWVQENHLLNNKHLYAPGRWLPVLDSSARLHRFKFCSNVCHAALCNFVEIYHRCLPNQLYQLSQMLNQSVYWKISQQTNVTNHITHIASPKNWGEILHQ